MVERLVMGYMPRQRIKVERASSSTVINSPPPKDALPKIRERAKVTTARYASEGRSRMRYDGKDLSIF